jgi:rhomboid protease GluP
MNQSDQEAYHHTAPPQSGRMTRTSSSKPALTFTIMGITILVYLLQEISGFLFNGIDIPASLGMKVNTLIVQGEYWRLITPVLLHGSILHIAFNMYALYIFGPGLERHFGRWRFLTLYILSGFAGNVFSFVFSSANSLGSSTAVFGLIAAQGVFLFQNQDLFPGMARAAITQIATIAAINLIIGMNPGIDNWGHIGGLIGGLLFTWMAGPKLAVQGFAPYLEVHDQRESRSVILAALSVALLFLLIVGITISNRAL